MTTTGKETKTEKKAPKALAWIGLVLGALLLFSGLVADEGRIGSFLLGLALLLPAGWWFYCQDQDRKRAEHHARAAHTNAQLAQLLGPGDQTVLQGMGEAEPPAPVRRRWPVVTVASIALAGMGAGLLPASEYEPTGGASISETTQTTTSTTTTSPSSTTTSNPTEESRRSDQARASEEAKRSAEARQREEEARRADEERRAEQARAEEERRAEQARAEAEARAAQEAEARAAEERAAAERTAAEQAATQQQGFVAPAQAPAPAQSTYYQNCRAVWDDIGRPIYSGEPGYASHLDKNGDGVGCESRPR